MNGYTLGHIYHNPKILDVWCKEGEEVFVIPKVYHGSKESMPAKYGATVALGLGIDGIDFAKAGIKASFALYYDSNGEKPEWGAPFDRIFEVRGNVNYRYDRETGLYLTSEKLEVVNLILIAKPSKSDRIKFMDMPDRGYSAYLRQKQGRRFHWFGRRNKCPAR
ncbi:MAG: hypothetical protein LBF28_02860 [Rickettsiales bacterium]|nr:hypothetical protein [Rickettsiales bacterium]